MVLVWLARIIQDGKASLDFVLQASVMTGKWYQWMVLAKTVLNMKEANMKRT